MVDFNEQDELGRPVWGFAYPDSHRHEWRKMLTSSDFENHWQCRARVKTSGYPCGAQAITKGSAENLTSDEALATLRAKLTGVEIESDTEVSVDYKDGKVEVWTVSGEKMAELKAAARELSHNVGNLRAQLRLALLVEDLEPVKRRAEDGS